MTYNKPLPPIRYLLSLADDAKFPNSRQKITRVASKWGFPDSVTDFLELYPANEIFKSRADFLTRCQELEMLITQERASPKEFTRSPQD